jgi:serine/threonine protein phosphatase PrpC
MTYIAVSGLSQVGLVRDNNEDSLVVGPWTLCGTETDSPQTLVFPVGTPVVVAVADGLGGHPGGELACSLVVRLLARAGPSLGGKEAIREVRANAQVDLPGRGEHSRRDDTRRGDRPDGPLTDTWHGHRPDAHPLRNDAHPSR